MKPIIIAGPTASGKTDIALALAQKMGGIIISADSRQVFKGLPIGTAAPLGQWQGGLYIVQGVPYYLADVLDITERFDVSQFIAAAQQVSAQNQNRQIIFAGGTGMYLQSYFCGMDNLPKADDALRAKLRHMVQAQGKEYLHAQLAKLDSVSATQIPYGNVQRTMRALEICLLTGQAASTLKSGKFYDNFPPEKAHFFILNWDKILLNERIVLRTQQIFDGMCTEAKTAFNNGYSKEAPGLSSLGYREAIMFLEGSLTKAAALERITILTRQYAKRQRTWFARYTAAHKINFDTPAFNAAQIADYIFDATQTQ